MLKETFLTNARLMTVESLRNNPSYRLLLMLEFDDLLPFVKEQLWSRTFSIQVYFALNILLLGAIIAHGWWEIAQERNTLSQILEQFGLGTLLAFTIGIVVHEAVHGLAFKLNGASRISFGGSLKQLYFYAVADKFVLDRKSFLIVALAPFLVITLAAAIALFFVPPHVQWIFFGVLLMHTSACAGDFALVSFYEKNRHFTEMLTYDDVQKKISYFYVKE